MLSRRRFLAAGFGTALFRAVTGVNSSIGRLPRWLPSARDVISSDPANGHCCPGPSGTRWFAVGRSPCFVRRSGGLKSKTQRKTTMPKTLLAIGAHYDDCIFGIPGILVQALCKHYRVVILSVIGDYTNWAPVKGRAKSCSTAPLRSARSSGRKCAYLKYAFHRFDVNLETKLRRRRGGCPCAAGCRFHDVAARPPPRPRGGLHTEQSGAAARRPAARPGAVQGAESHLCQQDLCR